MLSAIPYLAAGSSGDDIAKVIGGIIVVGLWALGGLASHINKRQQEARKRELQQRARMGVPTPMVAPVPPVAQRPRPPVATMPPMRPKPAHGIPLPPRASTLPPRPVSRPMPPRMPPRPIGTPKAAPRPVMSLPKAPALPRPVVRPSTSAAVLQPVVAAMAVRRPVEETEIARHPEAALSAVPSTGDLVRSWLQAGSLRRQYILTEILQPPVGLRQDHL
jgi:hypothetical protein